MKYFTTISILLFFNNLVVISQNMKDMTGEYYLEGVPEVASVIHLHSDATFDFFFSTGAMDRSGHGKWLVEGDTLILHNKEKSSQSFKLINSTTTEDKLTTIKISDKNKMILGYVHYKIVSPTGTFTGITNDEGMARVTTENVDSIYLWHALWPDKAFSEFAIADKKLNFFEFSIEKSISNIHFNQLKLILKKDTLTGGHPLLEGNQFKYIKNGSY